MSVLVTQEQGQGGVWLPKADSYLLILLVYFPSSNVKAHAIAVIFLLWAPGLFGLYCPKICT